MSDDILHDVRARPAAERLLEDSWAARSRRAPRRELLSETAAAAAFLAVAAPLAAGVVLGHGVDALRCAVLVVVCALVSRVVRLPVGTGFASPSYLVLVPMLLLVPPALAPMLVCAALVLGSLGRWVAGRARAHEMLLSVPDAWYALGPAVVLAAAGDVHGARRAGTYVVAFLAGCLLDVAASGVREWLVSGVSPGLQLRVVLTTWTLDACFAPLGLGIALLAGPHLLGLALLVPIGALIALADRDRTARIASAHERLDALAHERERLQAAVRHHEHLQAQTLTDALTRLGNRRALAEALEREIPIAALDAPLLLAIFDLDGFKAYNDTYGHLAGDDLLARLGHRLRGAVGPDGSAFRLGGDEFCVLLPGSAAGEARLRDAVAALAETDGDVPVTASCGTVRVPTEARDAAQAMALGDRRMYEHKRSRGLDPAERVREVLREILGAHEAGSADRPSLDRFARRVAERMDPALVAALHDATRTPARSRPPIASSGAVPREPAQIGFEVADGEGDLLALGRATG